VTVKELIDLLRAYPEYFDIKIKVLDPMEGGSLLYDPELELENELLIIS
jgi:hypothetical protein